MAFSSDEALVQNLNRSRFPSWSQFSYLFRYLSKTEGWVLRTSVIILFASAALLVGRYINRHWIPEPTVGGTYTEAVIGNPRFLNPVLASSDIDLAITPLLFSGLLRQMPDGHYANDIAQSVEQGKDGKTYTVKLKPNLTWHDGQPLTSEDVNFTIESIQNPSVASPRYSSFRGIKVEVKDDTTLQFTLEEANPKFLDLLTVGILPAHIWSDIPPASMGITEYNLKPVGNGSFQFVEYRKKEKSGDLSGMTLERFQTAATKPMLDTLKLKFVTDAQAGIDAVKNGQADGVRLTNPDLYAKAEKIRGAHLSSVPLPQAVAVFFNLKQTVLASKEVRLALRDSLDINHAISAARDSAQRIAGPVLPGMLGGSNDPIVSSANVEGAKQRLEQAGWKMENGVYQKGKQSLEFTLTVPDIPEYTAAAKVISESWKSLGANVEVKIEDPTTLVKDIIKPRLFDAILYADRYDSSLELFPFWHSTQSFDPGLNLTNFYNKDLDTAVNTTRKPDATESEIATANKKAQTIIIQESPAVFLYQPEAIIATTAPLRTTANQTLLTASNRFVNVTDWYINTKHTWKWNP